MTCNCFQGCVHTCQCLCCPLPWRCPHQWLTGRRTHLQMMTCKNKPGIPNQDIWPSPKYVKLCTIREIIYPLLPTKMRTSCHLLWVPKVSALEVFRQYMDSKLGDDIHFQWHTINMKIGATGEVKEVCTPTYLHGSMKLCCVYSGNTECYSRMELSTFLPRNDRDSLVAQATPVKWLNIPTWV